MKTFAIALTLAFSFVAFAQEANPQNGVPAGETMPAPTLPLIQKDLCPFEGCIYRRWQARHAVPVFDTWKPNRRKIGTIMTGEFVDAKTGVNIIFQPDRLELTEDVAELEAKKGDSVFQFGDCTEGFYDMWVNGKMYRCADGGLMAHAKVMQTRRREWWVLLHRGNGQDGWAKMSFKAVDFAGTDQLAGEGAK